MMRKRNDHDLRAVLAVAAIAAGAFFPACKCGDGGGSDATADGGGGTDGGIVPGADGGPDASADGGGGGGTDGAASANGATCAYGGDPVHTCECADGMDNDGDGNVDSTDIHCFGPLDDDESSFSTGISGDNNGSNGSWECPFDGNSGPGNDVAACCNADPTMNATPNGCDFNGCCEVDLNGNGTGEHTHIAGTCDYTPTCAAAGTLGCACTGTTDCDTGQFCVFDDDIAGGTGFCSNCEPCTPDAMCDNPCSCGEMCFGDFVQPDCGAGGCGAGVTACPGGDADCNAAANESCSNGCCYATCPAGVMPCATTADCTDTTQVCVTGCCVIIN